MRRNFEYGLVAFVLAVILALCLMGGRASGGERGMEARLGASLARMAPRPPELRYSPWRTAPIAVAEVFGRAQGCEDADPELVDLTAKEAIRAGLDPAVAAATIAVESSCNQLAISPSKGALGLMQVVPKWWKDRYDFGKVNLLNRADNVRVGTEIMADLVNRYGTATGVHKYNGDGVGCPTCDAAYPSKILSLAHKDARP